MGDATGGTVDQVVEQAMNTPRYAVLAAGLAESVAATTIDRQCGSSQQAVSLATEGAISGAYDVVAAGVESMSRVPTWSKRARRDRPVRTGHRRPLPARLGRALG
jgi:acetyl-CoA acyltransferase